MFLASLPSTPKILFRESQSYFLGCIAVRHVGGFGLVSTGSIGGLFTVAFAVSMAMEEYSQHMICPIASIPCHDHYCNMNLKCGIQERQATISIGKGRSRKTRQSVGAIITLALRLAIVILLIYVLLRFTFDFVRTII